MDSHDDDFRGNRARAGYWKGIWLRNQMSVLNFRGVSTVVVFVYHFFSDKDFTANNLLVSRVEIDAARNAAFPGATFATRLLCVRYERALGAGGAVRALPTLGLQG